MENRLIKIESMLNSKEFLSKVLSIIDDIISYGFEESSGTAVRLIYNFFQKRLVVNFKLLRIKK